MCGFIESLNTKCSLIAPSGHPCNTPRHPFPYGPSLVVRVVPPLATLGTPPGILHEPPSARPRTTADSSWEQAVGLSSEEARTRGWA